MEDFLYNALYFIEDYKLVVIFSFIGLMALFFLYKFIKTQKKALKDKANQPQKKKSFKEIIIDGLKERVKTFGFWLQAILLLSYSFITSGLFFLILLGNFYDDNKLPESDDDLFDIWVYAIQDFPAYYFKALTFSSLKIYGFNISLVVYSSILCSYTFITFFVWFLKYLTRTRDIGANKKVDDLFGSASWETEEKMIKAKLITPNNKKRAFDKREVIVGRRGLGDFIAYAGQAFIGLIAPTRSGKGVGFIMPNMINYSQNIVVFDPKADTMETCGKIREKRFNQKVFIYEPFSLKTHRFNPFAYVDFGNDVVLTEDILSQIDTRLKGHGMVASGGDFSTQIFGLAKLVFPERPNEKDPFFSNQARNLFVINCNIYRDLMWTKKGLEFVKRKKIIMPETPTMFFIGSMASGINLIDEDTNMEKVVSLMEFFGGEEDKSGDNLRALSPATRNMWNNFKTMGGARETYSSVQGVYTSAFAPYNNAMIRNFTSANDFDFRRLRIDEVSIGVIANPKESTIVGPILELFFNVMIYSNLILPIHDPQCKRSCLMLMDEFTLCGYLETFVKAVGIMAEYNMRPAFVFQSKAQLENDPPLGYGRNGAKTILDNLSLNMYYGINNDNYYEHFEKLSKVLGKYTRQDVSRSIDDNTGKTNTSISNKERFLMTPDELMTMGDELIILENTLKPIKCHKALYYDDPFFTDELIKVSPSLSKKYKLGKVPNQATFYDDLQAAKTRGELSYDKSLVPVGSSEL
ncbi:sodium:calcium antiporter [Helicobacter pylori]|uniref:VirD4 family type IV secretion system ATPase Cag5 n=1 Tax=Helicobacter pylori TaxID=210 RepID=UPI000BE9057D|nr:VirD4 family type IV secretion system ATPase Cag5 [Helicobacter pylori]PDW61363.1 sodium:calcium antiporter [Helicobacter pylori]